jgi:hypothetical protein
MKYPLNSQQKCDSVFNHKAGNPQRALIPRKSARPIIMLRELKQTPVGLSCAQLRAQLFRWSSSDTSNRSQGDALISEAHRDFGLKGWSHGGQYQ